VDDTGCNACNLKRVPDWEMPEQDARDPRRRTEHATTGWRSLTSKVANLRGRDRVSSVAPRRSTLAPGRAESPSISGSCSRLKNIILSSPPLHLLFTILSPTTVEHGVSWIRCGAENLRPYLSSYPSPSCSLHPDRFSTESDTLTGARPLCDPQLPIPFRLPLPVLSLAAEIVDKAFAVPPSNVVRLNSHTTSLV
jgi:hypothetical protein